jgi:hypothetical protein
VTKNKVILLDVIQVALVFGIYACLFFTVPWMGAKPISEFPKSSFPGAIPDGAKSFIIGHGSPTFFHFGPPLQEPLILSVILLILVIF